MKAKNFIISLLIIHSLTFSYKYSGSIVYSQDVVSALKDKLNELSVTSSNTFFIDHCRAFLSVIDAKAELTDTDTSLLSAAYEAFSNPGIEGNPSELSSYLNRQRPFIMSWISPTDGAVSFSWLKTPVDWNPSKEYPLYIELHGLWGVADNPIDYLTYPFRQGAADIFAFEDGYLLSPWGRGNFWYKGISETDIWECIAELEKTVKIDPSRKYLCGHSMGGYGAWYIGSKSVNTWAALGIHAGALWYDYSMMTADVFETFKNMPVYFVVGNVDGLYNINLSAYQQLGAEGNNNIKFVTFNGGHDYLAENVQNMYLWMKEFTNDDWYISNDIPGKVHALKEGIKCIPNPVRNHGLLTYQVEEPAKISIDLFDMVGRNVSRLGKGNKLAGEHNLDFDATGLASGTYTCLLKVNDRINTIKIVVIK
jgi:hypothetical protein